MFWLSAFFVGWIILMALRGYVRGFWVSLFDFAALVAAYTACIIFGQKVVDMLSDRGIATHFAYLGGFIGLFVVVNLLVSLGPRAALASALRKQKLLAWQGAVLGGLGGLFSGLVMVWCFNLANGLLFNKSNTEEALQANSEETLEEDNKNSFLISTANSLMASAAKAGAKLSGANPQQASMISAIATAPTEFTRDLKAVSQSPELKSFYSDQHVQHLMATNNHEALVANYRFQALMQNSAAQDLRHLVAQHHPETVKQKSGINETNDVALDKYFASELTYLWQRLTLLKNDSEVQELLQDDEVQQLIQENDIAKLLSNRKIQKLLSILLEDDTELQNVDFTQYIDGSENRASENKAAERKSQAQQVYRWVNAQGRVQYSEKSAIPEDRLSTAKIVQ